MHRVIMLGGSIGKKYIRQVLVDVFGGNKKIK